MRRVFVGRQGRAIEHWRGLFDDVRGGLRGLRRTPGFTVTAGVLFGVGVASCATVFSFIEAVLLRPLPLPEPGRLVKVEERYREPRPDRSPVRSLTLPDIERIAEGASSLEAVTGILGGGSTPLTGRGPAHRIRSAQVTPAFFDVAGVRPVRGRGFEASDQEQAAEPVVVLGASAARRFFGDASPVDSLLMLNYAAHRVVGIMPAGFSFPENTEIWTPLRRSVFATRFHVVVTVGRLRPGASAAGAEAEVDGLMAAAATAEPAADHGGGGRVTPLRHALTASVRPALTLLGAAAALVLLLVCFNVGGLLLNRTFGRSRELAVRRSLGAPNGRVIRLLVFEGLILGVAGAAIGLLVCATTLRLVIALSPADLPFRDAIRLDARVAGVTALLAMFAGLVAGVVPALRARSGAAAEVLRSERSRPGLGRSGPVLVATQIALATVLVVGAGLLLRSFVEAIRVRPGLRVDGVLVASLSVPAALYPERSQQLDFIGRVTDAIRALPDVEAAEVGLFAPLAGGIGGEIEIVGSDQKQRAYLHPVSPGYLSLMGVPYLSGRAFDTGDVEGAEPAAIISRLAADRFFPGQSPLGGRLKFEGREWNVVGVAEDVHLEGVLSEVQPAIWVPYAQYSFGGASIVIPARTDAEALAGGVRQAIHSVDADVPIDAFETVAQTVSRSLARPRFFTVLVGVFGLLALCVSIAGLYAVIVFSVRRRLFELGIRAALGANPADNLRLVLGQGLRVAASGLIVGLLLAVWLSRSLAGLLFHTRTHDPIVFAGALSSCSRRRSPRR